jgi:hypothetical protein
VDGWHCAGSGYGRLIDCSFKEEGVLIAVGWALDVGLLQTAAAA